MWRVLSLFSVSALIEVKEKKNCYNLICGRNFSEFISKTSGRFSEELSRIGLKEWFGTNLFMFHIKTDLSKNRTYVKWFIISFKKYTTSIEIIINISNPSENSTNQYLELNKRPLIKLCSHFLYSSAALVATQEHS